MFLPWVGLFEQIKAADVYVHYDDVQLPQGRSFMNRVQIKTPNGSQWLTAPVIRGERLIKDTVFDHSQNWRDKQLRTLTHNYAKAPFVEEMLTLAESIYSIETNSLSEFNIYAIEKIAHYFELDCIFEKSSNYNIQGSSSDKLLGLIFRLGGSVYITGHGARNYLDHELFEKSGIRVEYIQYLRTPYPQLYEAFDPHVTILDLIANVGKSGIQWINSPTRYWKEFINE